MQTLHLSTERNSEMINITSQVQKVVTESGIKRGICLIHAPHTTAGVSIQEGYDPDVTRDILATLGELVPREGDYRHAEGNSDAHIKALVVGTGQMLPIEFGKVQLGRWQAIFFCEFDGPRQRSVWVQIISEGKE